MTLSLQAVESGDYSSALSTATDATGTTGYLFNAESIAGTAANDYATASSALDSVSSLTGSSGVDLTGQQAAAQTQKIANVLMAIPVIGTAIGGALLAITQAAGYAHAGVGICGTDPPNSLSLGDLQNWAHYTPWQDSTANAAPDGQSWLPGADPAGSFEDFANRALAYNRALQDNCFSSASIPFPVLLAQLIASWNGTHHGPLRTVTRQMPSGNLPSPPVPGFDPISFALEMASQANPPPNGRMSFQVNGGAVIPKVVSLKLRTSTASGTATGSVAKTVAVGAAIAVGVGAAGVGAYAALTGTSFLGVLHGIWGSTGGRLIAHVNPLPAVARETVGAAFGEAAGRESTTVQTLIFPRPRYSEARAKAWAHAKGYVARKTDITAKSIRLRQHPPSAFKKGSFRTITLGSSGVRAVIGHLR